MKKSILLAFAVIMAVAEMAQSSDSGLRVWEGNVVTYQAPVDNIDSITFVSKNAIGDALVGDLITGITPIFEEGVEVGYTMSFLHHDPINIYHGRNGADGQDGVDGQDGADGHDGKDGADGKDGKDGANGANGADGHSPVIAVAKADDGINYWTIDGEWIYDTDANKIRVTGQDGKDGVDGKDGKDGADGKDGKDGDSMFQSVTQDENYVYFTLTNGQIIKVAITPNNTTEGGSPIINGAILAPFSVSATNQVYFSQGNLQYQASTGTWRFAEHQYDRVGEDNANISATYEGWIDLFGWGTSGWNSGAVAYQPYSTSTTNSDYYPGGSYMNDLTGSFANADWGVYNAISNGGNQAGQWRTLTKDEWDYLLNTRKDAEVLKAHALVNYVPGLILFPDNFNFPWGLYVKRNDATFSCNNYDIYHWKLLEQAGAIFLPACGGLASEVYLSDNAYYWSSTAVDADKVWDMLFSDENMAVVHKHPRSNGRSVRLVKDVE